MCVGGVAVADLLGVGGTMASSVLCCGVVLCCSAGRLFCTVEAFCARLCVCVCVCACVRERERGNANSEKRVLPSSDSKSE